MGLSPKAVFDGLPFRVYLCPEFALNTRETEEAGSWSVSGSLSRLSGSFGLWSVFSEK